jgi:benzylsuccinate CoA-transferase BbsF subunit
VLEKLAKWCNVIVESFRPGVLKKWGFDYAQVSQLNPEVIMLSVSIFGQTGPRALTPGWGYYTQGFQGLPNYTGWPDRPGLSPPLAYTDTCTPWLAFSALMAALEYRHQTGKGQYIDFSQLEAGLHFIPGYNLLNYFVNEQEMDRNGNHDNAACPHAVYPCRGEDRWCAICIFTDEEWEKLCKIMGSPAWAEDSKFSTLRNRKLHEDELDNLIAQWTCNLPAEDIMHLMQAEAIACGVVQNCADLMERDPQLRHRGYWKKLSRPGLEERRHPGWPVQLSKTVREIKPSPRFCEHTEMICKEFLLMNDEEISLLIAQGVLEVGF